VDALQGDEQNVSWMKVDDQMHGHRKFVKLGSERIAATGLWVTAGSWAAAAMTDGFVPDYIAAQWDPSLTLAKALVVVKLWHVDKVDGEDGFRFHDWCEINGSKEEIQATRRDAAERQRRSRDRRRQSDGTLGPDDGGGGSHQETLDIVTGDSSTAGTVTPIVTSDRVTRDGAVTDALVTPAHPTPPHPTQEEQKTSPPAPRAGRKKKITRDYPPAFEAFWAVYPRRDGKGPAFDMWTRALDEGITAETMTDGARRYARTRRGKDPQFTKHGKTWINQEGWLDAPQLRAVGRRDQTTGRLTEIG
jgi:hypothetical protein